MLLYDEGVIVKFFSSEDGVYGASAPMLDASMLGLVPDRGTQNSWDPALSVSTCVASMRD